MIITAAAAHSLRMDGMQSPRRIFSG